jgi:hypothetical protein
MLTKSVAQLSPTQNYQSRLSHNRPKLTNSSPEDARRVRQIRNNQSWTRTCRFQWAKDDPYVHRPPTGAQGTDCTLLCTTPPDGTWTTWMITLTVYKGLPEFVPAMMVWSQSRLLCHTILPLRRMPSILQLPSPSESSPLMSLPSSTLPQIHVDPVPPPSSTSLVTKIKPQTFEPPPRS